jgi:hypothetical protein
MDMRKASIAIALVALVALAGPALAGGNGKGGGKGGSTSTEGHLVVPDGVYGHTVTASANPGGTDVYVLAKCFANDGTLVWGGYFAVDANLQAFVGPISAPNWANANASCTAEEGYFTRAGFGKWVGLAATTFKVSAA